MKLAGGRKAPIAAGMGEVRVSLAVLLRVPGIADDVRGIDRFTSQVTIQAKHAQRGQRFLTVGRELVCGWRSTKAVTCADPSWAQKGENWRTALK